MNASPALGLGAADLELLAAHGTPAVFARREILPLDGATLVVVTSGYFRIFRRAAFVRDVTLGLAARGDIVSAGNAFGERGAESGAEALCDASVVLLAPDAWSACAQTQPGLHLKMAASLGKRMVRLQKRVEDLSRAGVASRVAGTLLELAADFGVRAPAGTRLDLPLSQEDLARLAGTTRETCSSVVADFARRGLVRGGRLRGMLLLDPTGLQHVADAAL